jgi:hypothetical protein
VVAGSKKIDCSCGTEMKFVMCIGYEGWGGPFQYIDDMPFFLGESALYIYSSRAKVKTTAF